MKVNHQLTIIDMNSDINKYIKKKNTNGLARLQ